MRRSALSLFMTLALGASLAAGPASAQQEPGAPGTSQAIPEKDRSRPQDQPGSQIPPGTPAENLSDRLQRSDGVIRPPGDVDPEIHKEAPATGTTPVIPPPGSPGSAQPNVDPK